MKKNVKRDGSIIFENDILRYNYFSDYISKSVGKIYFYETKYVDDLMLQDIGCGFNSTKFIKIVL
jgi:hypothetical protein